VVNPESVPVAMLVKFAPAPITGLPLFGTNAVVRLGFVEILPDTSQPPEQTPVLPVFHAERVANDVLGLTNHPEPTLK
jgi:hypothetical protein